MTHLHALASAGVLLAAIVATVAPAHARVAEAPPTRIDERGAANPPPLPSPRSERRIVLAQNGTGAPRVALVIANASYLDEPTSIRHAIADARVIAAELHRFGFDVVTGEDLSKQKMEAAIDSLMAKIRPGSVALLFFSGYGIQAGRQSYIIPVNASIWNESEVRHYGISLESILATMKDAGAATRLAIVDAARRNPFEERFRSPAGLALLSCSIGSAVLYSAEPGKVATDGEGENSLFMTELLKGLRTPGLSVETIFNNTRMAVARASRFQQVPWVSSALVDEFRFGRAREPAPRVSTAPEPRHAPAAGARSQDDRLIQSCDEALQRDPNDADAYYQRGQAYARLHQFARAVADFTEAIRLRPQDAEAFNNRCWTRAALGQLQAAMTDCNEALRLRVDFTDALDSRALVFLKLGQVDHAIVDYDAALRANPKLASALYGRGKAKLKKGDTAGGNADVNAARRLDPGIEAEFARYAID
jgi:uncharacterized caspase-like protein